MIVKHKFLDNNIPKDTEILIIGTFNPDKEGNEAEYFYGRSRNYLWRILSNCYQVEDLKGKSTNEKIKFAENHKIAFIDLVKSADYKDKNVDYDDVKLDLHVHDWNNVDKLVSSLMHLRKVVFTRKTFNDIPNIKKEIDKVHAVCKERNIDYANLVSPARFVNDKKTNEWKLFLLK